MNFTGVGFFFIYLARKKLFFCKMSRNDYKLVLFFYSYCKSQDSLVARDRIKNDSAARLQVYSVNYRVG